MVTYLRGTPCWLPRTARSFSRAAASSWAASSFANGCQPRPMRKRPLIRKAFMETASQRRGLLKNLPASASNRQNRTEMLAQLVRDLPRHASNREEVFRVGVREVFGGLEARIDQRLGPQLADPLDPAQFLVNSRRDRFRGLQLEDAPLDSLVPGAQLEGLRVRAQGVVVPAHLHQHVALGGPGLLVVRIELGQTIVGVERGFQLSELLEDVPAVQHRGRVVRLDPEDQVEAVQCF